MSHNLMSYVEKICLDTVMDPRVEISDQPQPAVRESILAALKDFNEAAVPGVDPRPLTISLTDPETEVVIGGLVARSVWDHLFIELLFVPERLRGGGWGTKLMDMAENAAKERGCRVVWLDTYSFQARPFYENRGYMLFGTLHDFPPGHARYYLRKVLA